MPQRLQLQWPSVNDGYTYMDEYISHRQQKGDRKPVTVLEFYCNKHADSGTQQQWKARIEKAQASVNGVTATAGQILRHGDKLSYQRLPWKEPDSPNYIDVLYEDTHLVALSKPSGLQVLPAAQHQQRTVLTLLQHYYQTERAGTTSECIKPCEGASASPWDASHTAGHASCGLLLQLQDLPAAAGRHQTAGAATPPSMVPMLPVESCSSSSVVVPVHRLGKGTSGLLLCARSQQAKQQLAEVMTHTTLTDVSSSTCAEMHLSDNAAALADSGGDCAQARYQWPGAHTQTSVMIDAAGQVPAGAVRKMYRTRVRGVMQADSGEVCVPIGRVHYPGVRGGLWAACPAFDSEAGTAHTATISSQSSASAATCPVVKTAARTAATANAAITGNGSSAASQDTGGSGQAQQGCGAGAEAYPHVLQHGKPARSKWSVVHRDVDTNTSLLDVEIFTGRPHQIRIHMAAMGHPLVGDPLYGPGGLPMTVQPPQGQLQPEPGCHPPPIDKVPGGKEGADDDDHTHGSETGLHKAGAGHAEGSLHVREDTTMDAGSKLVVPGDGGYHLHSWQLLLHHPVLPGKVLHLAAPLPEELRAPWETCS